MGRRWGGGGIVRRRWGAGGVRWGRKWGGGWGEGVGEGVGECVGEGVGEGVGGEGMGEVVGRRWVVGKTLGWRNMCEDIDLVRSGYWSMLCSIKVHVLRSSSLTTESSASALLHLLSSG